MIKAIIALLFLMIRRGASFPTLDHCNNAQGPLVHQNQTRFVVATPNHINIYDNNFTLNL